MENNTPYHTFGAGAYGNAQGNEVNRGYADPRYNNFDFARAGHQPPGQELIHMRGPHPAPRAAEMRPGMAGSPGVSDFASKNPEIPVRTISAIRQCCETIGEKFVALTTELLNEYGIKGRDGAIQYSKELGLTSMDSRRLIDSLRPPSALKESNKSNKTKSRVSDSPAVSTGVSLPEAFDGVDSRIMPNSSASTLNNAACTVLIELFHCLWCDLSEAWHQKKSTPFGLEFDVKHLLKHWLATLCHLKTKGAGQLNSLTKTQRTKVEEILLKNVRTCMQNVQSDKKEKDSKGIYEEARAEEKRRKEAGLPDPTDEEKAEEQKAKKKKAQEIWEKIMKMVNARRGTQPAGAGAVQPEGAGAVQPAGAGAVQPEGAGAVQPEGAGGVVPEGAGGVVPAGAGPVQPAAAVEQPAAEATVAGQPAAQPPAPMGAEVVPPRTTRRRQQQQQQQQQQPAKKKRQQSG